MAESYYKSAYTGGQIDASIGAIVNGEIDEAARAAQESARSAGASAEAASSSAGVASGAAQAVKDALDNLPPGAVPVINDLTTGGAAVALSAEMGKTLNAAMSKKANAIETDVSGVDLNMLTDAGARYFIRTNCQNRPQKSLYQGHLSVFGFSGYIYQVYVEDISIAPSAFYRSQNDGYWGAWVQIATATPPEDVPLQIETGFSETVNGGKNCIVKTQEGMVTVAFDVTCLASGMDQRFATLPAGYQSNDGAVSCNSAGGHNTNGWVSAPVSINNGLYANISVGPTAVNRLIGSSTFRASTTSSNVQSYLRMPMVETKSSRSAIPREPETRLMCVVDSAGNYVEFVLVTLAYDAEGALYTVHYYALQDGERLVDSPRPPAMRPHAGAVGFVRPKWDADTPAWVEGATAEETTAWEDEHPDPAKTAEAVRAKRDTLLKETDRYAVLDAPISAETRAAFYAYRQALRDVPEQSSFPGAVAWPELPTVGKAAPDPVDAAFDIMTGGEPNA